MNKINNKIICLSFIVLAIFGLAIMPEKTHAIRYGGYVSASPVQNNNEPITNLLPVINFISPKSSNVGVGTKTITITGEGFVPGSVARVNGSNRSTTFIDGSHLLMQITGNDTYLYRSNGGFFITVFNRAPGGGYSNAVSFNINSSATSTASAITSNQNESPSNTYTNFTDAPQAESGTADENFSDLASNAIF